MRERESSGIQNQGIVSQSQETKGHDRGIEDQDQNTGNHAQGRGGQGRETEGLGQETEDQGLRTANQDTGLGLGTSPGTEEIGQGQGRRKRKRKGTDPVQERGITRNTRRRGHERGEDHYQDPGRGKANTRAKMTTTVRN